MKKRTLGVMIGNANSPYTIETLKGINEAAKQNDVNVISFIGVHSSYFYREYFQNEHQEDYDYQSSCVFDYHKLCDIDALILAYGTMSIFMSERDLLELQRKVSHKPTIYLEKNIEGTNSRYLIADNRSGIKLIMEHMIRFHGYKNILYLSGPMGNFDAEERLAAYKESMENAGLFYDESMIAYGDFSESVATTVNDLLDANPDAEALVCANDTMAVAVYAVLARRAELYQEAKKVNDKKSMLRYKKHLIGAASEHGIAITGYDNIDDSGNVDPPLTTVVQSPYSHGYSAVSTALALLDNPSTAESMMVPPKLVHRQSCGCSQVGSIDFPALDDRYRVNPELYAGTITQIFTNSILPSDLNEKISNEVYEILYEIFLRNIKNYVGVTGKPFSDDEIFADVRRFFSSTASKYVPRMTFASTFNEYMMSMLRNAKEGREKDVLIKAESRISDYIYSQLFSETRDELSLYRNRTWFLPLISRDMANDLDSPKIMYRNAMMKLKFLEIGDLYLFVTNESVSHRRNDKWECPSELRLVAFSDKGIITSYEPEDAPMISSDNLMNSCFESEDEAYNVSIISLFSGEYQYGIIVAKSLPEDVLSLYCASIQISIALKYCEMAIEQKKIQKELQHIVKEVEDKNEILRSLSEYDQLTECFNRRGFLEKGLELIRNNAGKEACLIFADLDHLKEINDKYGHSEGDFAIEHIAKTIRQALPDSSIIARFGGDEFVALFVLKEGMEAEDFVRNISNRSIQFNSQSDKPYYVECSAGYSVFECSDDTSLEKVIGVADSYLYEAKAKRRKTIVRKAQAK